MCKCTVFLSADGIPLLPVPCKPLSWQHGTIAQTYALQLAGWVHHPVELNYRRHASAQDAKRRGSLVHSSDDACISGLLTHSGS